MISLISIRLTNRRYKEMKNENIIGKKVVDTNPQYYGDEGVITDLRHFHGVDKTYAVVEWNSNSKHGPHAIRNYRPDILGKRLQVRD